MTSTNGIGRATAVATARSREDDGAAGSTSAEAAGSTAPEAEARPQAAAPSSSWLSMLGAVPSAGGGRVPAGEGAQGGAAMYATGWLKRGPSGVILTNVADAEETAHALLEQVHADRGQVA